MAVGPGEREVARAGDVLDSVLHHEPDVDAILEGGQQDDGGWTFDWLAWSPGQTVEWRGALTLRALQVLAAHGRIELGS
jgi:hypothetical protein